MRPAAAECARAIWHNDAAAAAVKLKVCCHCALTCVCHCQLCDGGGEHHNHNFLGALSALNLQSNYTQAKDKSPQIFKPVPLLFPALISPSLCDLSLVFNHSERRQPKFKIGNLETVFNRVK